MTDTHAPSVLIVEDDHDLSEALCETLELADVPVCEAGDGEQALRRIAEGNVGLVVSDVQMQPMNGHVLLQRIRQQHPTLPVVMMTAHGTIERAVQAMRDGADDYLVKPFDASQLVGLAQRFLRTDDRQVTPIAEDEASVQLLDIAGRVAATDATVLITGESGVGKEVVARHVHHHSTRRSGPFVAINCAAIPESMLEATLFGHEKGAFTGATQAYAGKFEQAQGGTLLLDEISEMALPLQAKLLRVLQEHEVERIGGRGAIELDVRVIATTNRNLREEIAAGRFREDLYYRLNVVPLNVPALRERPADIVPLAERLLARHAFRMRRDTPSLSAGARRTLLEHRWPGNVRELDNLMQRALILGAKTEVDAASLHFERDDKIPSPAATTSSAGGSELNDIVRRSESAVILDALRENRGNRRATAAKLGVSERTLRYKLARLRENGALASAGY
ncbi:sigma-54 dependent transcriptional regulator [Oleiagrimonas sp. C23AA]|uniref:sigma-54-dependent transcriptional regulator n=1 Tax=Oleiagrimonas sp. C23AA TaxID=2719047 RepID=UPI001423EB43|nr:sigma-54 dependent transcriptional regulator [Oleiagrimonas sp. C23AA]NII09196.1 sigma-54-dependent Fis family transcriptional regulator [Oleiagrimonas sp. C23AA]